MQKWRVIRWKADGEEDGKNLPGTNHPWIIELSQLSGAIQSKILIQASILTRTDAPTWHSAAIRRLWLTSRPRWETFEALSENFFVLISMPGVRFTCKVFFPPIPCTYTSWPLDGVARNHISCVIYLDTQESCNLLCPNAFIPTSCARGEKKKHLVSAGIKPRSLCFNYSQATVLTTRPCLLGQIHI